MIKTFTATVMLLLLMGASAASQSQQSKKAEQRAHHLRHGINASEWFAQSSDYSVSRLAKYTTDEDLDLIRQLGFDHVRLSVDPAIFACFERGQTDCGPVATLDHVVTKCLELDLAVILDIHPTTEFKQRLATDDVAVLRFADLWQKIATHFRDRDAERVFFEIMNEPEMRDPYRWIAVQQKALLSIRHAAPEHTVIVAGARWSDIEDLIFLEPYSDQNVIYNFHFYEPHIFTHQGATWGEYFWRSLGKVPYPGTPENVRTALAPLDDDFARWRLTQYALEKWDRQHVEGEIDFAAQWARNRHVPIICNEFGVYRNYSDEASRVTWLGDVRSALEKNGIGWTMWDYRGGFGVVRLQGEKREPDAEVVRALGLHPGNK